MTGSTDDRRPDPPASELPLTEYSTRVVVVNDRYVCLQLPLDWPEGEASITVSIDRMKPAEVVEVPAETILESPTWTPAIETVRDEVEWWDEA